MGLTSTQGIIDVISSENQKVLNCCLETARVRNWFQTKSRFSPSCWMPVQSFLNGLKEVRFMKPFFRSWSIKNDVMQIWTKTKPPDVSGGFALTLTKIFGLNQTKSYWEVLYDHHFQLACHVWAELFMWCEKLLNMIRGECNLVVFSSALKGYHPHENRQLTNSECNKDRAKSQNIWNISFCDMP